MNLESNYLYPVCFHYLLTLKELKQPSSVVGSVINVVANASKNVVNSAANTDHFGICHTGISIGRCSIDWYANSFVQLRPASSTNAVLCADTSYKGNTMYSMTGAELKDMLTKVAVEICKWNAMVTYNAKSEIGGPNQGNCQNFTFALLQILDSKPTDFSPHVGTFHVSIPSNKLVEYLSNYKLYNTADRVFRMTKTFNKTFFQNDKAEQVVFMSHEQLDQFYTKLLQVCPNFEKEYASIHDLLKSFDRAYWLRQLKNPSEETRPCHNGCPLVPPKVVVPANTNDLDEYMEPDDDEV